MALTFAGPATVNQVIGLTPASPGCSSSTGTLNCQISLTLPAGSYTGSIATYDEAPAGGIIPPNANLLAQASNLLLTVVTGAANGANFTLTGIVNSLSVGSLPTGVEGTPISAQPFSVAAKDADGYTIVGTYNVPIAIANADASGHTSVATSGTDHPAAGTLVSSSDVATFSYDGVATNTATVTAKATHATTGSATFTPFTVPAPTFAAISAPYGATGTTVPETLTGTNFTPAGTTVAASGSGVTLQNVVVVNPTTITANFVIDPSALPVSHVVSVTSSSGSSARAFLVTNHTLTVTLATDSNAGANGTGAGNAGDLRYAMNQANGTPGAAILFACGSTCHISLNGTLPAITSNMAIDGGAYGTVVIAGATLRRLFWVESASVVLAGIEFKNALATGGSGGGTNGGAGGGGGGGAGLGAGIFVNQAGAQVTVVNGLFYNMTVTGGNAGPSLSSGTSTGGGGGGGLAYAGGQPTGTNASGGGGGGGILSVGNDAGSSTGGNGGDGGGAGGGDSGLAGTAFLSNAAGSNADNSGNGAAGGFGGGGGGAAYGSAGAAGGLFGGGGGGGMGAAGGAGGGGGGGSNLNVGAGGQLATIAGGTGDSNSFGGGGAAAGPAIFINAGSVFTQNSGAQLMTATGGNPGGGSATAGGADSTPVFNFAGTVNGSTTSGPVAAALSGAAPSLLPRPAKKRPLREVPASGAKPSK